MCVETFRHGFFAVLGGWLNCREFPSKDSSKRAGQLEADQMRQAVIGEPEVSVLGVADEVLGEQRVASPEAIGDVDATGQALLLRA